MIDFSDFILNDKSNKTLLIAEIGINHNGNIDLAKKMVIAAKEAGADAVKIQSFKADLFCDLYLEETKEVEEIAMGTQSSYNMYKNLELSLNEHIVLLDLAKEIDVVLFSSVFDEKTVSELETLGWPAYKISSGDITNKPLIKKVAKTKKTVLVSTGMSSLEEVHKVVSWSKDNGPLVLMHCSSLYPPELSEINLNVLDTFKKELPCMIGYSDHSMNHLVSLGAVAKGARVLEKHFTLDHDLPGPDQQVSLDKKEFKKYVEEIRQMEIVLGANEKYPFDRELGAQNSSRRSLRVAKDVKANTVLTEELVICLKPLKGIIPEAINEVLGKRVKMDLKKHQPIAWDMLEEDN